MEVIVTIKTTEDRINDLLKTAPSTAKINISFLDEDLIKDPKELGKSGSELWQSIVKL